MYPNGNKKYASYNNTNIIMPCIVRLAIIKSFEPLNIPIGTINIYDITL